MFFDVLVCFVDVENLWVVVNVFVCIFEFRCFYKKGIFYVCIVKDCVCWFGWDDWLVYVYNCFGNLLFVESYVVEVMVEYE